LHFLNLREGYDEKELKDAIMDNSQKILLELDREFAFVSKEYPFLSEMLKIY
jgi:predicted nuclease of restriction endonuclease-like (RecB) superfamily